MPFVRHSYSNKKGELLEIVLTGRSKKGKVVEKRHFFVIMPYFGRRLACPLLYFARTAAAAAAAEAA